MFGAGREQRSRLSGLEDRRTSIYARPARIWRRAESTILMPRKAPIAWQASPAPGRLALLRRSRRDGIGDHGMNRTPDLRGRSSPLSPLSYVTWKIEY